VGKVKNNICRGSHEKERVIIDEHNQAQL